MPREIEQGLGAGGDAGAADLFVGRDLELSALAASLASIVAGAGRMDIVTGAPGIGKTRLLQEFAALAEADGARVLRAGCWEGEGAPPFWPWTLILREILGEPTTGDAVAAVPELRVLLQRALAAQSVEGLVEVGDSRDAEQARFDLFDRFATLLRELSHERPLVVAIDDAQCADSGSVLLLQFLAGRLADARIGVLVTARDPVPEAISGTCRHPWARHLALTGLGRADACRLLEVRAGQPPRPEVVDRLMALTDGNPFYLRELGHVLMNTPGPVEVLSLPPSLTGVTMHQFDSLSPACRALLQVASVIGREFEATLAATICGLSTSDALNLLQEALDRHVVTLLPPTRFRFAHALVREGVYDRLHVSERTNVHQKASLMLEKRLGDGSQACLAALAHHTFLGLPRTDRTKAAAYAVSAGQQAHAAYAYEDAVALFRRAQHISTARADEPETCEILLLLGGSLAASGDWAAARVTFADASDLARQSNDRPRLARAALGFKGLMSGTIPVDSAAVAMLDEAHHRLDNDYPALRVEILSALSRSLYFAGDPTSVDSYSSEALRIAIDLRDDPLRGVALEARSLAQWQPGLVDQLSDTTAEILSIGTRSHDPLLSFHARMLRFWIFATRGQMHHADLELLAAAQLATTVRHPRLTWQIALATASRAISRGDFAAADHWHARSIDLGQRVHDSSPDQHHIAQSFFRALLSSELTGWETLAERASRRFPTVTGYRAALALVHARSGNALAARAHLQPFVLSNFDTIEPTNLTLFIYMILAEAIVNLGDADAAERLDLRLRPFAEYQIVAGWGTVLAGSVDRVLGLLSDTRNDHAGAAQHFERALRFDSLLDSPPLAAHTAIAFARHLALHGAPSSYSRARDLAQQAAAAFTAAGLHKPAAEAEGLATSLLTGNDVSQPSLAHHSPGTPQLIRRGDFWHLQFAEQSVQLRHSAGIKYLSMILAAGGTAVHVLDLVDSRERPITAPPRSHHADVDSRARAEYKQRIKDLSTEIDLAEAANDLGLIDRLTHEREALLAHLSAALGIGRRSRIAARSSERARINVRNRITDALNRLRVLHPVAWSHFRHSIRTGTFCRYVPDRPIVWRT